MQSKEKGTTVEFSPVANVGGELSLPGDKSVSHRAVMFAAMAEGRSEIRNLSNGEDVQSTVRCFKQLGTSIIEEGDALVIEGSGFGGFTRPDKPLYAGNSGTTARLMMGILAGQPFATEITGDESLSKRPMGRIMNPLREMNASFDATEGDRLPVTVHGGTLKPVTYTLPVASAQVKSAVLLAGLHLEEASCVIESVPSRDHTELMLGLAVEETNGKRKIYSSRKNYPKAQNYFVPSDISTAAFFAVLASLKEGSTLTVKHVSFNPNRKSYLKLLQEMGAEITEANVKTSAGETYGDLVIKGGALKNITIPGEIIPGIIDEIPILSATGLFAEGEFEVRGAKELRVKESDRIDALCRNYRLLGVAVEEYDDGFKLSGAPGKEHVTFASYGDHRIAMTFAVVSMLLEQGGSVSGFDCASISNPDFLKQIALIT